VIGRGLSLETVSGSLTNKDPHSQDLVLVDLGPLAVELGLRDVAGIAHAPGITEGGTEHRGMKRMVAFSLYRPRLRIRSTGGPTPRGPACGKLGCRWQILITQKGGHLMSRQREGAGRGLAGRVGLRAPAKIPGQAGKRVFGDRLCDVAVELDAQAPHGRGEVGRG
jgi:hypothetical protein